jgi:cold-inducible RNA-binding protein
LGAAAVLFVSCWKSSLTVPLILASICIVRSNRLCPFLPRFAALQIQKEKHNMKNIFVGNLSFGATEDSVRSLFEQYGTVDRVSIVTDRDTGQAKGFGFVEMSGDAEGLRAIECLSGHELNGRAMTVNEARPKADRGSGGGGGGPRRNNNRW